MSDEPRIIVHGGAWAIPDELVEAHREGCRRAVEVGLAAFARGGDAADAVEAAVRVMEDDEIFDAGRGSFLNLDGVVELDAGFMEGTCLNVGAVAGVRDIANPITLARRVMEGEHVFIIGEGASRYAETHGMARCDQARLVVPRELATWHRYQETRDLGEPWGARDTVGAIARDAAGHIVAGVSTGGRPLKLPGRVGDVPCAGCGFYADDAVGAAVSTGEGEAILRIVMAKRAVDQLAEGGVPDDVARATIDYLSRRVQGRAGVILLDAQGRVGSAFSTGRMARAWNDGSTIISRVG